MNLNVIKDKPKTDETTNMLQNQNASKGCFYSSHVSSEEITGTLLRKGIEDLIKKGKYQEAKKK